MGISIYVAANGKCNTVLMVKKTPLLFAMLWTDPHAFRTKSSLHGRSPRPPSSNNSPSGGDEGHSNFIGTSNNAGVTQRRNANSELMDDISDQRWNMRSINEESSPYIFETASLVVDHYLSPTAVIATSDSNDHHPLSRIIDDSYEVPPHWIGQMFTPLYGASEIGRPLFESSKRLDTKTRLSNRHGKRSRRTNLKITVAYRGTDFCGWEDQRHDLYRSAKHSRNNSMVQDDFRTDYIPVLPSVQGTLADILDPVLAMRDEIKTVSDDSSTDGSEEATKRHTSEKAEIHHRRKNTSPCKPIEIKVAGRTDAGVSSIGQICRIRTWRALDDGIENYVKDLVHEHVAIGGEGLGLRIRSVECVGDDFHPTFGAACRAYAYLLDLPMDDNGMNDDYREGEANVGAFSTQRMSPTLVPKMNAILQILERKELDYFAFSYGKVKSQTTLCTLYHARAEIVEWVCSKHEPGRPIAQKKRAICIELVGDRFLRRMVRIMVATALREANRAECQPDAILNILLAGDRNRGAPAALPVGLIFVGASFNIEPS